MKGHAQGSYPNLELQWHTIEQESSRGKFIMGLSLEQSNNTLLSRWKALRNSHMQMFILDYSPIPLIEMSQSPWLDRCDTFIKYGYINTTQRCKHRWFYNHPIWSRMSKFWILMENEVFVSFDNTNFVLLLDSLNTMAYQIIRHGDTYATAFKNSIMNDLPLLV